MRLYDLFLFGPPVVIGLGAWVVVRMEIRRSRIERELARREGPAE